MPSCPEFPAAGCARARHAGHATKVVRLALENAVSVAGVLLPTEATMTPIEDEGAGRKPGGESFERGRRQETNS